MKRLATEPLLHFVALGAALYALLAMEGREDLAPRNGRIVVTDGKIEHLGALFARALERPLAREELESMTEDYIREEVAYREGLAMGLDGEDSVIRRRVRQKSDLFAEDLAAQVEPTEDELSAYHSAQVEAFRIAPRFSFRQACFDPARRGDALTQDVRDTLARLERDPVMDVSMPGDPTALDLAYAGASAKEIAGLSGEPFAATITAQEPGAWHGPIESGFGVHVVIADERDEGRVPQLAEVRGAVRREWENARRVDVIERFHEQMLANYEIDVQWPAGTAEGSER